MSIKIERLVEAKIVAALAVVVTNRPVVGFWQKAAAGTQKIIPRSCVEVTVKPRSCDGWGSDIRQLSVVIAILAGYEDNPTAVNIIDDFEAVMDVLEAWCSADNAETAAALSVPGFDAQGFTLEDGGDSGLDPQSAQWFATEQCTIMGCLVEVVPETEE